MGKWASSVNLLKEFALFEQHCGLCLGVSIHADMHSKVANAIVWLCSFQGFCCAIGVNQVELGVIGEFFSKARGA